MPQSRRFLHITVRHPTSVDGCRKKCNVPRACPPCYTNEMLISPLSTVATAQHVRIRLTARAAYVYSSRDAWRQNERQQDGKVTERKMNRLDGQREKLDKQQKGQSTLESSELAGRSIAFRNGHADAVYDNASFPQF